MRNTALILAFAGLLIFLAHLFVALFRKTRVPDVLLLIFIGLILGPVTGIVQQEHFGKVGPVFAQVALALILFEGGHESRWDVLRENWKGCLALIFPAFIGAFLLGAALMKFYFGLNNESACLFGAILGSASPSVIVPLVRHLRMHRGPALVLTLESALADVLCLVLVLGFLEAHESGGVRIGGIVLHILSSFFVAGVIGAGVGLGWSLILTRIRSIENNIFLTLALVFVLFGSLDALHLSGGVAVLLFGMAIANAGSLPMPWLRRMGPVEPVQFTGREKAFFSEMVFLIKTFFFVYLGLSLHLKDWKAMAVALGLVAAINVIRLPFVRMAMNAGTTRRDAALMTVMCPKGLAAAVLASLPFQQGWEHGELIRDISYGVILFSIVGTSVMVFLLETTPFSRFLHSFFPRPIALAEEAAPAAKRTPGPVA